MGGWGAAPRPGRLYPRERRGTHFTGGWVGPKAGLDGAENLFSTGIRHRTVQPVAQSLYRLSYPAHNTQISSFQWELSCLTRTDRHNEANGRFSKFYERV